MFKMIIKVPFYKQIRNLDCGPIALKMALEFLGGEHTIEEIEKSMEINEGKGITSIKLAIAARKLGFETEFFSRVIGFNKENIEMDFYQKYGDIPGENELQELINEAKNIGVKLYEKILPLNDIINNIREDRVIIVLLDWNVIKGKEGYHGHFVPVVGYNDENIYVHNQGTKKPQEFMPLRKEIFEMARKAKGTDEDIIVIHRK